MIYPLEIKNLSYCYPGSDRKILDDIDLKIEKGETVAIVGLSGTGKSTLCYSMCGIIPHVYSGSMNGEVFINGVSTLTLKLPQISQKLGIVFQDPDTQLFSPTVEDEIAFGPENLCIDRDEIGIRISEALNLVKMQEQRLRNPNMLSGGQKQLIALAAVLSLKPEILIFDEVMSQIDAEGKKAIKNIIMNLKKSGKTIIMVEHDFKNLDIADRIIELKDGKLKSFDGTL